MPTGCSPGAGPEHRPASRLTPTSAPHSITIYNHYSFISLQKFHMNTVGISSLPRRAAILLLASLAGVTATAVSNDTCYQFRYEGNPLVRHKHTADPAVMVVGDTLWLFTGCDEPGNKEGYHMPNWCAFSTTDMNDWTEHPIPMYADDFKWNEAHVSYAGHPVQGPDGTIKPVQPTR